MERGDKLQIGSQNADMDMATDGRMHMGEMWMDDIGFVLWIQQRVGLI